MKFGLSVIVLPIPTLVQIDIKCKQPEHRSDKYILCPHTVSVCEFLYYKYDQCCNFCRFIKICLNYLYLLYVIIWDLQIDSILDGRIKFHKF